MYQVFIRRSCLYERCEVHWCCTAAVGVVPLLYCADAFEIRRVGIVPRCVQDGTPNNTRSHRITVRSCHKTKTLKFGYCYTVAATTSKASGVKQAHSSSSSSQHSKNEQEQKKLKVTAVLETVFLIPTVR